MTEERRTDDSGIEIRGAWLQPLCTGSTGA